LRIAYFDCFSGISGDMALGALVDAGADFNALKEGLAALGVGGYEINAEKVTQNGIAATSVSVIPHGHEAGHHHTRAFSEIRRIIEKSSLSQAVKSKSVAIFRRLGEAEAKIHSTDIE